MGQTNPKRAATFPTLFPNANERLMAFIWSFYLNYQQETAGKRQFPVY
jgi:hypothetical protein